MEEEEQVHDLDHDVDGFELREQGALAVVQVGVAEFAADIVGWSGLVLDADGLEGVFNAALAAEIGQLFASTARPSLLIRRIDTRLAECKRLLELLNLLGPAYFVPLLQPLVNVLLESHALLFLDLPEDDLAWQLAELVHSGDLVAVEVI